MPLVTITAIQGVLTMGAYSISVVIPDAAPDLGIAAESVGYLVAGMYLTAMLVGLGSGQLIAAYGVTRVFQVLLALVGLGALVVTFGGVVATGVAVILIGSASGPMNPAGSFVLARVAGPQIRALVFSLKQCGTPMGGMVAGTLLPALTLAYDWRIAMLSLPVFALVLIVLTPLGSLGGAPPATESKQKANVWSAVWAVAADPGLRAVTLSGFGFGICQMALATYVVVFLWQSAGYSPAEAGLVFAVLHLSGIVSRVVLGLIADRWLATRWVLVILGLVMGLALAVIGEISSAWPLAAVYSVMVAAGVSGNGWVGLYFAELARLADPDRIAEVAAGSQFVTYLGIVCGPTAFALALGITGSYTQCFQMLAVLSVACGVYLAVAGR
ncbi:MAG: MFS transporter [Chromatiales bacterium]|nr:MFS transporter [Chromatiales bacterium]